MKKDYNRYAYKGIKSNSFKTQFLSFLIILVLLMSALRTDILFGFLGQVAGKIFGHAHDSFSGYDLTTDLKAFRNEGTLYASYAVFASILLSITAFIFKDSVQGKNLTADSTDRVPEASLPDRFRGGSITLKDIVRLKAVVDRNGG